jgi:hypothetical protein
LYWIDDQFGTNASLASRQITLKILTLWSMNEGESLAHPLIHEIPAGSARDKVEEKVLAAIQSAGSGDIARQLSESVDHQIAAHDPSYSVGVNDLSPIQFEQIKNAFEEGLATVCTLSYAAWTEQWDEIKKTINHNVVFFVDHDFTREEGGRADTGEEILATLLSVETPSFNCILFTHGVEREHQSQARAKIATKINHFEERHRFSVVSKENLTGSAADFSALSRAFQDAFVQDWCHSITRRTMAIFIDSFKETSDKMLGLDFEEVAAAFFRKPYDDGSLEFDVLVRVLTLTARAKLEDSRHKDEIVWEDLAKIRNVLSVSQIENVRTPTNATLAAWRQREIFDPAEVVNEMFCPPFLGDLYSVKDGAKVRYFVLIGQPCDLSVRHTGHRNSADGLFLEVSDKPPKSDSFAYRFEFPTLGSRWIRYQKALSVNLNLLDLVSFRKDGESQFDATVTPSKLMLPGVHHRFENFMSSFMSRLKPDGGQNDDFPSKYRRLTNQNELRGTEAKIDRSTVRLPISRLGRIRSPHAEAILGGFAMHHARIAFEFNFADLSSYCESDPVEPEECSP